MRDYQILLNDFAIIDVLECTINKKINDHAYAHFVAHIDNENESKFIEKAYNESGVTISIIDSSKNQTLIFNGIILRMEIQTFNHVKTMTLDIVSRSYLMDIVENTRTFFDKNWTYKKVAEYCMDKSKYSNKKIKIKVNNKIDEIFVQYQETDWNFIKRIASRVNSFLLPDYLDGELSFYFGMPNLKQDNNSNENIVFYTIKKDMKEYNFKKQHLPPNIDYREIDATYYIYKSREIYKIADMIQFKDYGNLFIYAIESNLVGSELIHTYYLKTEKGFLIPEYFNNNIIGASLKSKVVDIKNDDVQIHYDFDDSDTSDERWFSYSTVYSSPDGTGWYVMPEKDDSVRLYFPDADERNSFVISSVHMPDDKRSSNARTDPDQKSMKTKHGKEVLFTPDRLVFTNNDGMMIEIKDNEGITIESNKNINIKADDSIKIESKISDIKIKGATQIKLEQGTTNILLKENIEFNGAQVKIQ